MRTCLALGALLLIGLVLVPESAVQADDKPDHKAIREAIGPVANMIERDKANVDGAVEGIKKLEGMLDYESAILLLSYFDDCDRAWDATSGDRNAPKEARGRPVDSYKIANAILECIRRMSFPEEVLQFAIREDITNPEKHALRVRMAMVDAIARHAGDNKECLDFLMDYAKDQTADTDLRVIVVIHLADHGEIADVQSRLMVTLRDPSWRVRDASIEALTKIASHNEGVITLALINALAVEEGKLRQSLRDALRKITGQRLGTDSDEWADWYKNRHRKDGGLPPRKGGDDGTRVKVFGTETFSDRYVFVIDTSISMLEKISPEEKEDLRKSITGTPGEEKDPRRPLDWTRIENKLDLAREEIIRSLEVMNPEKTKFTIIAFAQKMTMWKEELLPTTPENVNDVTTWLRDLRGEKLTNVFGALDAAYDLSERLAGIDVDKRNKRRSKRDKTVTGPHRDEALPDTIFLYTDGFATYGKYSGDDKNWMKYSMEEKAKLYQVIMREMHKEITDRNRVARITINTVGVGKRQDYTTLRDIARNTGGSYVGLGR